jgi:UDP-N-acetylglucosamine--N-acetylmuramyl-(pentapeptide) pyrophosphoryl-undecaprenol N-acetylglucosamine transferase
MNSNSRTLVFTGGHHSSALPVALKLKERGWNIIWIGHRYSMLEDTSDSAEYREVSASKITFYELKAGKYFGGFSFRQLIQIPFGFINAINILVKIKNTSGINLVGIVSFGGYLALPVIVSGWLLGIPGVTHEQTTVSGLANRIISKFVKIIALTWPQSSTNFPSNKTVVVGLPIRPELSKIIYKPSKEGLPVLYFTGGKQGSHLINSAVFQALNKLLTEYEIFHQTGSNSVYRDYENAFLVKNNISPEYSKRYHPKTYLSPSETAQVLAKSNVVIGRAGAHIVYELAYLGIPSVLIPIPWSSRKEQDSNADYLVQNNLAVKLPETTLSTDTLLKSISKALLLDPHPLPVPKDSLEKISILIENTFTKS